MGKAQKNAELLKREKKNNSKATEIFFPCFLPLSLLVGSSSESSALVNHRLTQITQTFQRRRGGLNGQRASKERIKLKGNRNFLASLGWLAAARKVARE